MKQTVWGRVPNYSGYIVSIDGNIRSLDRQLSNRYVKGVLLMGEIGNTGYPRVALYTSMGTRKKFSIHRVMLETFIGLSDLTGDHINEVKSDNRLENLRWLSIRDNTARSAYRNSQPGYSDSGYDSIRAVRLGREEWKAIRLKHSEVKARRNRKLLNPSIESLALEYELTVRQIRSALYTEPRWARL